MTIDNDPVALVEAVLEAGPNPPVAIEATYGWYWAVDALEAAGAEVHLAHTLGVRMFQHERVKNDKRDAEHLADLLRMGRLPEAWISDPVTRDLRELVRHRNKLVQLRSGLRLQVHTLLAKEGITVPMSDLFGVAATRLLDELELPAVFAQRIHSSRCSARRHGVRRIPGATSISPWSSSPGPATSWARRCSASRQEPRTVSTMSRRLPVSSLPANTRSSYAVPVGPHRQRLGGGGGN